MQLELAAVHRREEVLAQPWIEKSDRPNPERDDRHQKDRAILHAEAQSTVVPGAQLFKVVLEGDLEANEWVAARLRLVYAVVLMSLQQVLRHGRHDSSREKVRRKHREDDRLGQGNEEIPCDAAKEKHRHKHDADGEGRNEGWYRDL